MLTHNYDYRSTLETSERVGWKLDELIAGRAFDFTKPFLPDSLAGVNAIECLSPSEKLVLNHIRSYTYLFLFGLVEECIVPFNLDHARTAVHGDDHELRAILRFTEEEAKHIQMFKWAVAEVGKGLGATCQTIGPVTDVVPAFLAHSRLGFALAALCLEWMSQSHYVDGIKGARELDPLFTRMLEYHWVEEAQHAKLDVLMIEKIAGGLSAAEIETGVDDFLKIGGMLDRAFGQQVQFDLACLASALGRTFSSAETAEIVTVQHRAYRRTFLHVGITHPKFDRTLRELSASGHARVAAVGATLG